MATTIMCGFPLYRCSWFCGPIVPAALTRSMIRCLDSVCPKPATFKGNYDDAKHRKGTTGVASGI
jgi:hypothetical protein